MLNGRPTGGVVPAHDEDPSILNPLQSLLVTSEIVREISCSLLPDCNPTRNCVGILCRYVPSAIHADLCHTLSLFHLSFT